MKHVWTGPQPEKAWRPRVYSNPPFGSGGVAVDHKRLRMKTFSGGVWMMSSAAAEGGVSMWNILKEFPVVSVWTQTTNGAGTPPSVRSDTGLCSDVAAVLRDYWICEENLDLENRDPQTLDPPETSDKHQHKPWRAQPEPALTWMASSMKTTACWRYRSSSVETQQSVRQSKTGNDLNAWSPSPQSALWLIFRPVKPSSE